MSTTPKPGAPIPGGGPPWDDITAAVARQAGAEVSVLRASPLAGGGSMETWSVDLRVGGGDEALVLRRDMAVNMSARALTRTQECRVLEAALARGVRCPRPRYRSGDEAVGRQWFLMDRCPGEGVGRKVVRLPELADARRGLAREMGRELARIHSIDLEALPFLPRAPAGTSPCEDALAWHDEVVASLRRENPVWALCARWLRQNLPKAAGVPRFVHGDFRVGNLLVTPAGLSAVIDWEFAHVGDVHEDIAWPTVRDWRFERDEHAVGGVGSLDDFLAAYAEHGGAEVDRGAVRWWAVMGNLRWSVVCHAQAERHLSGRDRSIELASLGRKSAEIDWEIVDLLDRAAGEG